MKRNKKYKTKLCFYINHEVDAVYAMAHALHKTIKENCGDIGFNQCDALQPAPTGAELLRAIRDVSFVGMQETQVIWILFRINFIIKY